MDQPGTQSCASSRRSIMIRRIFYALVAALNVGALAWLIATMMNTNVRVWEWSL